MLLCLGISRAPTANTTSTRTQATSGSSRCKIHKSRNTSTHLPLQRAVLLELERAAHLGGFFAAFRVAVSKISITNRSHHQSKKKKIIQSFCTVLPQQHLQLTKNTQALLLQYLLGFPRLLLPWVSAQQHQPHPWAAPGCCQNPTEPQNEAARSTG